MTSAANRVRPSFHGYGEYGYGKYKDVIDGLQFERLISASGPTNGELKRPSDGKIPQKVVFISCVGSRDNAKGAAVLLEDLLHVHRQAHHAVQA